jgi:hypothetical protein
MDTNSTKAPKFTPEDWFTWAFRIESHLQQKECYGSIDHVSNNWATTPQARRLKMQYNAFAEILKALGDEHCGLAQGLQSHQAHELWDLLRNEFGNPDVPARMDIDEEFQQFKHTDGDNVDMYIEKFDKICNKMRNTGIVVAPETIYIKLIKGLPENMSTIRDILTTKENPNLAFARRMLRQHRHRFNTPKSIFTVGGRRMVKRPPSNTCNYCKKDGHPRSDCRAKAADEKLGYYLPSRDAPWRCVMEESINKRIDLAVSEALQKMKNKYGKKESAHFNAASSDDEVIDYTSQEPETESTDPVEEAWIATEKSFSGYSFYSLTNPSGDQNRRWIIDSGATAHLLSDFSLLRNPKPINRKFNTGNADHPIMATFIGEVDFIAKSNGKMVTLKKVYFSPQTKVNILSIRAFARDEPDSHFRSVFEGNTCAIIHNGVKIFHGKIDRDELFFLESHDSVINEKANKSYTLSYSHDINYWHKILGHVHPRAIIEMARKNMVEGLPPDISGKDWKACPSCAQGKATKRNRNRSKTKLPKPITKPGDCTHSDQKGPITPISIHKNKYFILFVDECTGFTEVFFLPSLDKTQDAYELHKNRIKTLLNKNIKTFVCDGHKTYTCMIEQLDKDGTKIRIRAPYDPNGNAISERAIRTITEMARTLLQHSGLPQNRWEEAIEHAVWIRNRVLNKRLSDKTPYEAYFKIKPDIRHLHPFGCLAHALIPKELRTRTFQTHTHRCAFMGYSNRHDAFLLYDTDSRKTIISRDVLFFDEFFPLNNHPLTNTDSKEPSPPENTQEYNVTKQSLRSYTDNQTIPTIITNPTPIINNDPINPTTPPIKLIPDPIEPPHLNLNCILQHTMDHLPDTPGTQQEAHTGPNKEEWIEGTTTEYRGINRLNVFRKPTPAEVKIIQTENPKIFTNHSIFKIKTNEEGNVARWKVRLVLQGCFMEKGIHFDQTYSPCTRLETIRLLIAIAVQRGWKVTHADVPNAYLHGKLDKLIFTRIPLGWNKIIGDTLGMDGDIVVLDKALYGTPNAGRAWNQVIDKYLKTLGFQPCPNEQALYYHPSGTIIALWVDDVFITGPNRQHIQETLENLKNQYQIKTLGQVSYALGMHFQPQADGSYFISQKNMIDNIVKGCNLEKSQGTNSPLPSGYKLTIADCPQNKEQEEEMKNIPFRSTLGKLLYLAMATRPDTLFAVISLSRFANSPGKYHWSLLKHIVKYLKQTNTMGLHYKPSTKEINLETFTDASYNCDVDKGRSIYGYCLTVNKCCWVWHSSLSKTKPGSAQHAEVAAAYKALNDTRYASYLLNHCNVQYIKPIPFWMDNRAAIHTMTNPGITKESRFLRPKYFDIRDQQESKFISMTPISTDLLCADTLTKGLIGQAFARHRESLSVTLPPHDNAKLAQISPTSNLSMDHRNQDVSG